MSATGREKRANTKPGHDRQAQQAHDGLECDQDVGGQSHGHSTSVAYRCRGVNAEEEGLQKRRIDPGIEGVDQAPWSASVVEDSETTVERKVNRSDEDKKTAPGRTDQVGVGQKCTQASASLLHIEAAVTIEQAKLTLRRYDSAKPQITGRIFGRFSGCFQVLISHSANFRCSTASVICIQIAASSGS